MRLPAERFFKLPWRRKLLVHACSPSVREAITHGDMLMRDLQVGMNGISLPGLKMAS
jgi:hypothetical protein